MPDDTTIIAEFEKQHQPLGLKICPENLSEISQFDDCQIMSAGPYHPDDDVEHGDFLGVVVKTSEGKLKVEDGWIFEDADGQHYPISGEAVEQMYEVVDVLESSQN